MLETEREYGCTKCGQHFTVNADFEQFYSSPKPVRYTVLHGQMCVWNHLYWRSRVSRDSNIQANAYFMEILMLRQKFIRSAGIYHIYFFNFILWLFLKYNCHLWFFCSCPSTDCRSYRFTLLQDGKLVECSVLLSTFDARGNWTGKVSSNAAASYRDYQEVKIQEQVQKLEVGKIPRSIWAVLTDDLVDSCKPGDDVTVT